MTIVDDYNVWASFYDADANTTRDTEHKAFLYSMSKIPYKTVLELGCGTGKNTIYLAQSSKKVTAIDFSKQMISMAREKVTQKNVEFLVLDLQKPWNLQTNRYDLITCSLTLEHIKNINSVFNQAFKYLHEGGYFYIGELHPVKKYIGEGYPRYTVNETIIRISSFTHHFSDYISASIAAGFELYHCKDWFKPENKEVPNVISFIFTKPTK